jgi:vancomycin resistance protein YoaR
LYALDLVVSSGAVPRGVTVAGVSIGGLSESEAKAKLVAELEPRLTDSVALSAGTQKIALNPKSSGLGLDWDKTLASAGAQPLNPVTRITSFFSSRSLPVVSMENATALTAAVQRIATSTNRVPVNGTVAFAGTTPQALAPQNGSTLDVAKAVELIRGHWLDGTTLTLPVTVVEPQVTQAAVDKVIADFASPAVSAPLVLTGVATDPAAAAPKATVSQEVIASALTFKVENGVIDPKLDISKIKDAAGKQLAGTEQAVGNATVSFASGSPVVTSATPAKTINWDKTLQSVLDVLKSKDNRNIAVVYDQSTTGTDAAALGLVANIGEFATGNFAADAAANIQAIAAKVSGIVVQPGATFSLNSVGVSGNGASQFATTLYNAAYFAGMADSGHKDHNSYNANYPAARDVTLGEDQGGGGYDLKFKNNSKTAVAIQAVWTSSSITVRLWGTKTVNVQSSTSAPTNITGQGMTVIPAGQQCTPSAGVPGFEITDTRVITDLSGKELSRTTHTAKYAPQNAVGCGQ